MALRLLPSILILTIFVTNSFVAWGQVSNKNQGNINRFENKTNLKFDTSKTAIIKFDSKSNWPFDSTYKAAMLTQKELQVVDSFLLVCVTDFNNSLDKDYKWWSIDLKQRNYRKQLIVVVNKNGQKEVWVNCFCRVRDDRWKTEMFDVSDGGNCYFQFKVNLTLNMYYDIRVNGVAWQKFLMSSNDHLLSLN
ncbi:hypothetical protein SAMN05518672_11245 [Chitinophaga sp. CF118]|uniref:hypothetical protein n=1 Tax=Chitinophaga sp. CF118 TaxID=1884367 RepID=UPI0008EB8991|nr:hypothetical protein [Chitinophaga sp. CF118]SFE91722.1 hypothetical protein SAMN05518672_11245 [Chitinophaga sp. CF118]